MSTCKRRKIALENQTTADVLDVWCISESLFLADEYVWILHLYKLFSTYKML